MRNMRHFVPCAAAVAAAAAAAFTLAQPRGVLAAAVEALRPKPVAAETVTTPTQGANRFTVGTPELTFAFNNGSAAAWGCLDAVLVGGDPAPTSRGALADGPGAEFGATATWQLTATACDDAFPAAQLALDACTAVCASKKAVALTATSAWLRWEGCVTPFPSRRGAGANATLDVDISLSVTEGTSVWGATVGKSNAAGVCLQSLAVPDIRTLRAKGPEALVYPYMFGAQSNCSSPSPIAAASQFPELGHAGGANHEAAWMPNGWERTMSWAAWTSGPSQPRPPLAGDNGSVNTTGDHANNAAGSKGDATITGAGSSPVGLYVGCHDSDSRLKMMPVYCDGAAGARVGGIRAVHVPDTFNDGSTNDFALPYPVVVSAFRGGWWDAAQIYRAWVLDNARWTRKGNLSERADVPDWLLRAPLWVKTDDFSNGTTGNVASVDAFRSFLGNGTGITDVGVHWYSWNEEKFDTHYPIYTPKVGVKAAVAAMQQPKGGVTARVVPYTNGRLWDPSGPLPHAQASHATCNARNGTPYHETYASGVLFSVMNPATPYMQAEWSDAVGRIGATLGTSGVYTDQVSCSHSEACFDADGGTNASAWAAGAVAMLDKMTSKLGPGRVLISESHDEAMMSGLHAYLSIYGWIGAIGCGTELAWQAVYGGWSVNVGDIRVPSSPSVATPHGLTLNTTESAAYRAIAAQNFVAGNVLGWFGVSAAFQNAMGLGDADAAFVRALAAAKADNANFLVHGRLWRPVAWATPPPVVWIHDFGYMEHDPKQACPTNVVLAECWRATSGAFALVVANHGTADVTLDVVVDLTEPGQAPGSGRTVRVTRTVPALGVSVTPM